MTILDGATLGIAVFGAVLSLINTANALMRDRVRLIVRPTYNVAPGGDDWLAITVINVGFTPVTIAEVGFMRSRRAGRRYVFADAFTPHKLPYRLEPRASVAINMAPGSVEEVWRQRPRVAFATTECQKTFFRGGKFFRSSKER